MERFDRGARDPGGWARLWAAVRPSPRHPVEPGTLGEYAMVLQRRGPYAADSAFPEIADHLVTNCAQCIGDLREMLALAAAEAGLGRGGPHEAIYPAPDSPEPMHDSPWLPTAGPFRVRPGRTGEGGESDAIEFRGVVGADLTALVEPRGSGIAVRLRARDNDREGLGGWGVRVTVAGGASPVVGFTDEGGAVEFDTLAFEELHTARFELQAPERFGA